MRARIEECTATGRSVRGVVAGTVLVVDGERTDAVDGTFVTDCAVTISVPAVTMW